MLSILKSFIKLKINAGAIDLELIEATIKQQNFPYLVSFPRTGSHWLRMMLEKYSDRPLLTRSFYNHANQDFLLYHTHDMNLNTQRKNVIYLYRYPTDVIYSQLNYYQQDINNKHLILFWAKQYAIHLAHWLFLENNTEKKIFLTYEELKNNTISEFRKVTNFLELEWDERKIKKIKKEISKEQVAQKTKHNHQVINTSEAYVQKKIAFFKAYDKLIMGNLEGISQDLFDQSSRLLDLFK